MSLDRERIMAKAGFIRERRVGGNPQTCQSRSPRHCGYQGDTAGDRAERKKQNGRGRPPKETGEKKRL